MEAWPYKTTIVCIELSSFSARLLTWTSPRCAAFAPLLLTSLKTSAVSPTTLSVSARATIFPACVDICRRKWAQTLLSINPAPGTHGGSLAPQSFLPDLLLISSHSHLISFSLSPIAQSIFLSFRSPTWLVHPPPHPPFGPSTSCETPRHTVTAEKSLARAEAQDYEWSLFQETDSQV